MSRSVYVILLLTFITVGMILAPVEEYTAVRYFLEDRLMGLDGKLLGTEAHQWSWLKKDMVDGFFEVAKNFLSS